MLAVKQLTRADEDVFRKERDMLNLLTKVKHKHLISLLATYNFKGKHHMLFPYAPANLRTFWAAVPLPCWNADTYLWVLDQMTGLASALTATHQYQNSPTHDPKNGRDGFSRFLTAGFRNVKVAEEEAQYGRHGDIKPDNLLWRPDANSPGILILTDLGLREFNGRGSRSRINPIGLGGSQTYIPPEHFLQKPVLRAFDIWGLGCVYLEFITWLLVGAKAVEDFADSRLNNDLDPEVEDDAYYTVTVYGHTKNSSVRIAVTEHIHSLRKHPRCSKMIGEVLNLVEESMLKVEPRDRISAVELHERLRNLLQYSRQNQYHEFLVGQGAQDEGKGFKAPDFNLT